MLKQETRTEGDKREWDQWQDDYRRSQIESYKDALAKENLAGQCHYASYMFTDLRHLIGKPVVLVHAVMPSPGGYSFHAWAENRHWVFDVSLGQTWRKKAYYARWRLTEDRVKRYTRREMLEALLAHNTYGPWDEMFNDCEVTAKDGTVVGVKVKKKRRTAGT